MSIIGSLRVTPRPWDAINRVPTPSGRLKLTPKGCHSLASTWGGNPRVSRPRSGDPPPVGRDKSGPYAHPLHFYLTYLD